MSAPPRLAIIVITPPGQDQPEAAVLRSLHAADDGRVFTVMTPIITPVSPAGQSGYAAQRSGLAEAVASGAEWIFVLDAGERLHPKAFHMLAPALDSYDVVWGGFETGEFATGLDDSRLEDPRIAKFAARTLAEFYHMALEWWVGGSHLIRASTARDIQVEAGDDPACRSDYMSRLWRGARCLKTAQPLTRGAKLPELSRQDKAWLVADLASNRCFITLEHDGHSLHLPYTGRNPAIEREQLRGQFFEQPDLLPLKQILPEGSLIVDVGANTGNHTLFFSKILKARTVIPIEPNPEAIHFLKGMIAQNGLKNVDVSCLGVAVGAVRGRAGISTGRRGYLGTARMQKTDHGEVAVRPLDELISQKADMLKIDVEDMEAEVLAGAEKLIRRDRPVLMVEVMDENILPILDMTDRLGYTVRHIFADFGYANYLFMPGAAEDRI